MRDGLPSDLIGVRGDSKRHDFRLENEREERLRRLTTLAPRGLRSGQAGRGSWPDRRKCLE